MQPRVELELARAIASITAQARALARGHSRRLHSALAEEPGIGHVVGKSRDVAMVFFEDVLAARLDMISP